MASKLITELPLRGDFDETVNFAGDDTIQTYRITGAQIRSYLEPLSKDQALLMKNVGLQISAASGAMTVALKQKNGSTDPATGINSTEISFRSNTITSPNRTIVAFDAALSLVIPSGATLGYANGQDARVFVYAYYDGTNKGLAVCQGLLDETALHSIVAIDTASDGVALYGDAARSNAAVRLLGEFMINAITTAGTWTTPSFSIGGTFAPVGANYGGPKYFTTSGTYTKPAGLKFVVVEVVGGGGSGGGVQATGVSGFAEGAGGGGGGYSQKRILASALGSTETVTVGAGGVAAAAAGSGQTGGTSSFGSHCSATGGQGGALGAGTTTSATSAGGIGGDASGGDLNVSGGRGGPGAVYSTIFGLLNFGGGTRFSEPFYSTATNTLGSANTQGFGNGSSGARNGVSQSARGSTAGQPGVVIVHEYF